MRYVEERQRRRWHRGAITRRAQGGCGLIPRQNSSPMLWQCNRRPSLSEPRKTPARDPLYFFNSLPGGSSNVYASRRRRNTAKSAALPMGSAKLAVMKELFRASWLGGVLSLGDGEVAKRPMPAPEFRSPEDRLFHEGQCALDRGDQPITT